MHELSIVLSVLEIAEEKANELHAKTVQEIEMNIGELSGVDYDALAFAMDHAPKNEILRDVILTINKIPAKARCNVCKHEFMLNDLYTPCPKCNNYDNEIIQGEELKVKSIKID